MRTSAYIIRAPGDSSAAFCVKCTQDKPISDFYVHSVRTDGHIRHRPYCKQCRRRNKRSPKARPAHSRLIQTGAQTCFACSTTKPLTEFYSNGCFSDGVKKYRTKCKECVLKEAKHKHPAAYAAKSARRSSSPKNFISGILNHAAKRKQHLGFNLDLGYLLNLYEEQQGLCALSKVRMTYQAGAGRVATNISIDRIDSSVGYVRGNVQFVCDVVNRMKQDLTEPELLVWCARILENRSNG